MLPCVSFPVRVAAALLATALAAATLSGPTTATAATTGNPLAAPGPWNPSTITAANPEYANYLAEQDPTTKAALAKIANTPRMRWFANCSACNPSSVRQDVAAYVENTQQGDPAALTQLAIFGLWPDGEVVDGKRPPMSWSMEQYQAWITELAAGIGSARVAIVLEPDLAISANYGADGTTMPDPSAKLRKRMTRWSAAYLSSTLPHAAIYIDAGSADWLPVKKAVKLLRDSGIQHVRGFALGATHYDAVSDNVAFAAAVSKALQRAGVRGKRAIIDTADNGTPFTWQQWNKRWGKKWRKTGDRPYQFDNTPTCGSAQEKVCQTLGHRPTSDPLGPEARKLGLKRPEQRRMAKRYVDAYLWFGRGWRWMQQAGNNPESRERAIRMATWTRFTHPG